MDKQNLDLSASVLPPAYWPEANYVDQNIHDHDLYEFDKEEDFAKTPFKPRFSLDYISNVSGGVAVSSFNTGLAGSAVARFSDIIGNNQLYLALAINGEVYDFGGQVAYINQKWPVNFSVSVSHVPYSYGFRGFEQDTLSFGPEGNPQEVDNFYIDHLRIFEDRVSVLSYYPFSVTQRIEFGGSLSWYYSRLERTNYYYDGFQLLGTTEEKLESNIQYNVQEVMGAYVLDNSFFGMTSPLKGQRARFELTKYFGGYDFFAGLVDYRRYIYLNPISISFRVMHFGRYDIDINTGQTGEDFRDRRLSLFIGYPWLVRGYSGGSFSTSGSITGEDLTVNQLLGNKILVGNFEIRLPFSGIEQIALIQSQFFFTQLAVFFDAGIAYDHREDITFDWQPEAEDGSVPIFSTGVSVRVNLFGALILEPFYAFPLQRKSKSARNGVFGLNFTPGW